MVHIRTKGTVPFVRLHVERQAAMHEMALVHEVVNVVLAECEGKGVHEVRRVNLAVGETRDVIDAYVPGLFRYIAKGTIAENAEVTIRRIPFTVRCTECGDIFHIDSFVCCS